MKTTKIRTTNPPIAESKSSRQRKRQEAASETKERLLAQLEDVKHREEKLIERQATMELLYQDIRRELAQVEDIRRRSATELALAQNEKCSDADASNNPDDGKLSARCRGEPKRQRNKESRPSRGLQA